MVNPIQSVQPKLNLIAEVYIMVHFAGQIRFRLYVNDGVFSYQKSDRTFDAKIEAMSGRPISRISTTHEFAEYMENDRRGKIAIMATFEIMLEDLENPLQYLNQMYSKTMQICDDVVEFYVFPISKTN